MVKSVDTRDTISKSQNITLLLLSIAFCCFLFLNPSQNLDVFSGALLLGFIAIYLFCTTAKALGERKKEKEAKIDTKSPEASAKALCFPPFSFCFRLEHFGQDRIALCSGLRISQSLPGVPEELIGFSILAIGTSLPELAASISLLKRRAQDALGKHSGVQSLQHRFGGRGGRYSWSGTLNYAFPLDRLRFPSATDSTFVLLVEGADSLRKEGFVLLAGYLASSLFTWGL